MRVLMPNGTSEAYMIQGYEVNMCCGYPFMGRASPAVSNAEDAEDAGEDEDDE